MMKSNNFPDKDMLDMPPDLEGVTRPNKKAKTKLYKLRIRGIGNAALVLQTYAETEKDAIKCKFLKNPNCWYLKIEPVISEDFKTDLFKKII